jgi:anti-anti-sigma factor
MVRGARVFVRDLGSTNGTFLNDRRVQAEEEILHGDWLRIGPLQFDVTMRTGPPVGRMTPRPTKVASLPPAEEQAGALLLALPAENGNGEDADVAAGSTAVDIRLPQPVEFEEVGDAIVVRFRSRKLLTDGEIDYIGRQLQKLVDQSGRKKVLLNLADVKAMSSAMIGQLLALAKKLKAGNGKLVLCSLQPTIAPVFQSLKLGKVLTLRDTEHEGLEALR